MAININDLDNNLYPVDASSLSGDKTRTDNFRQLSETELKISGGTSRGNRVGNSSVVTDSDLDSDSVYRSYSISSPLRASSSSPVSRPFPVYDGENIDIDFDAEISSISRSISRSVSNHRPRR